MGTKIELLQNLLDQAKEKLTSIQNERCKLNDYELPANMKKKITDENFQKIIKLKNDDITTILEIQNEILALNEEDDDFCAYKNGAFENKITELNNTIDQTFAVVDQMKRETESLMNSEDVSNEFEDEDETFSIGANRSNEFFKNNLGSNSYGDSNSNVIPSIIGRLFNGFDLIFLIFRMQLLNINWVLCINSK